MSMPELEFAQKALDESYKRGFNDCLAKVQNDFYIIPKQTMDEWGGNFAGLVNQLMNMIVPNAAEDIDEDNDPELPPGYEAPPAEEFFVEQSLEPEVLPPPPPPAAPTRRPGRKSAADPRSAAALARQAEQEAQNAAALLNVTPPGNKPVAKKSKPVAPRPQPSHKAAPPPPAAPPVVSAPPQTRLTPAQQASLEDSYEKVAMGKKAGTGGASPVSWDKPYY